MKQVHFLFVITLITLFSKGTFALSGNDSLEKVRTHSFHSNIRFGVHGVSTYHQVFLESENNWENFFTTGIRLDFPTDIQNVYIHFGAEAGNIERKRRDRSIRIAHTSLQFSYIFHVHNNFIFIKPCLGLTSTIICLIPNIGMVKLAKEMTHPTRNFESEFGLRGGIEPFVKLERFVFGLSLSGEIVFSSPMNFITGNMSLMAGVVF